MQTLNTRLSQAPGRVTSVIGAGIAIAAVAWLFLQYQPTASVTVAEPKHPPTTSVPAHTKQPAHVRAAILAATNDITPDLPNFLQAPLLKASLTALEANGADLSLPMPSNHWIRSETEATAQDLITWAAANNFSASEPTIFLGHGGTEFFEVALTRVEVPKVNEIQQQGRAIRAGLANFHNARYTTWVGAITTAQ